MRIASYFRTLQMPKSVLWCYLLWYLSMAAMHFDPSPRLWLTAAGLSAVIGTGLILSVSRPGAERPDVWTVLRLFMMPFCVSSFSALIKDRGFVLIFSPVLAENAFAAGTCLVFLLICYALRKWPWVMTGDAVRM
jgi:hypothetical protein